MVYLVDKAEKKKATRHRPIFSCRACYVGKRKCDRQQPCSRCVKTSTKCEYFDNKQPKILVSKDSYPSSVETTTNRPSFGPENVWTPPPSATESLELPSAVRNMSTKVVVDQERQISRFYPSLFFPYFDSCSNSKYLIHRETQGAPTFDFSQEVKLLYTVEEIHSLLPSYDLLFMLWNHYWVSVHPVVPMFDKDDTDGKFAKLMYGHKDLYFTTEIFAILLASCFALENTRRFQKASIQTQDVPVDADQITEDLKKQLYRGLKSCKYLLRLNPTMASLRATAIVYFVGGLNYYDLTVQISQLVRECQIMGLHRNVGDQYRNLVYWAVMWMDVTASYANGLPTCIYHEYIDMKTTPTMTDLYTTCFVGRMKSVVLCGKVLALANRVDNIPEVTLQHELTWIDQEFLQRYAEISHINTKVATGNDLQLNLREIQFYQSNTLIPLHRAFCIYKYLSTSARDSTGKLDYEVVYGSLLLLNECCVSMSASDIKSELVWFMKTSYPVQGSMVILKDMKENPTVSYCFKNLPKYLVYTEFPEFDYTNDKIDFREVVMDKMVSLFEKYRELWPVSIQERINLIIDLKTLIWQQQNRGSRMEPQFAYDIEFLNGFQFSKFAAKQ